MLVDKVHIFDKVCAQYHTTKSTEDPEAQEEGHDKPSNQSPGLFWKISMIDIFKTRTHFSQMQTSTCLTIWSE